MNINRIIFKILTNISTSKNYKFRKEERKQLPFRIIHNSCSAGTWCKQYSLDHALDVSMNIIPSILLRAFLIILTLALLHSKGSVTTVTP